MRPARALLVAAVIACTVCGSVRAQYSQDFDALTAGDAMSGSDGWELWDLIDDDTLDADVSDDEAFNGENSLSILTTTDIVRAFSDEFTSGRWTVAMQCFIPDDMTGAGYFILLNTYNAPGAKNWSTQVTFDAETELISSLGGSGFTQAGSTDLITDEWFEISVRIDLDENTQEIYINDTMIASGIWQLTGSNAIECIDLFGNTAAPNFYYDDILIFADCDLDGVDDVIQIEDDPDLDCDENGVIDSCDPDCDDNGVADACDILEDPSLDCDGNDVLDQCQTSFSEPEVVYSSEADDGDMFGEALDVSGTVAVVSATRDSEDFTDGGAVYVFRLGVGGWSEEQRLVGEDTDTGDWLGTSVAIDGDWIAIGVYRDDDAGTSSGSVYMFEYDSGEWIEAQKLTAGDAAGSDQFGWAVALLGDTLVVGARATDDIDTNSGSAYVFEYDGDSWEEVQELIASDGEGSDQFGRAVAISEDWIVVGAMAADPAGVSGAGKAYVFSYDDTDGWIEDAILTASDGAAADQFGRAVAVDGNVALIGAPSEGDDAALLADAGAVYQFVHDDTTGWTEEAKWTASDVNADAEFGDAVSMSGSLAVVGAHMDSGEVGAAYVFIDEGTSWVEVGKLTPDGDDSGDFMGRAVAVDGPVIAAGAYGDGEGASEAGSATFMVYEDCNGNGVPDSCDIDDGVEDDDNLNGIPDDCEAGDIIIPDGNQFLRGDADNSGSFSALLDALFMMRFSFKGGDPIECYDAADADDNEMYSPLLDSLYVLIYAFQSGPEIPDPGPTSCGLDPEGDDLDCETPSPGCD